MAKINPSGKTMGQIAKEVQRGVTNQIQKNSVKVVPAAKPVSSTNASKLSSGGLENRGTKPTRQSQMNNARDLKWQRAERSFDAGNEMAYTGLKGGPDVPRNTAGRKLQSKLDKLTTIARGTVKINTNPVPSRTSTLQGAGGVLGGQHAGGHSDVMGAINMGGFTVKTPIIKPTSTKNK